MRSKNSKSNALESIYSKIQTLPLVKKIFNLEPRKLYVLSIVFILSVSFIFTFLNFNQRWGLGADDARDAMIALEALRRHELPLMGPFSSAGPFVFGGIYYWFIMLSYLVLPFFVNSPWIMMGLLNIAAVFIIIKIGEALEGKRLGIVLGLLTLSSPQLIGKALTLGNPNFVFIFSLLSIFSFLLFLKKKNPILALLMGVFLGFNLSFHYQAINLLILLPLVFLAFSIPFKKRLIAFLLSILGFIIPLIPFLYWDYLQGFANIRNVLDYLLIAQYRLYVPNSWKLFIFTYFPNYWSVVMGNVHILSIFLFISSLFYFVVNLITKKVSSAIGILGVVFMILLLVNRFYKGERSEGYLLYLAPFVLIFSAWFINRLIGYKYKVVGVGGLLLLLLVLVLNIKVILGTITYQSQVSQIREVISSLKKQFPEQKFSIYDYKFVTAANSLPLSLIAGFDKEIDDGGALVGICRDCTNLSSKIGELGSPIYDLRENRDISLEKGKTLWVRVNQKDIYDNQVGWLSKNQLKSTFSLKNYIMDKLPL